MKILSKVLGIFDRIEVVLATVTGVLIVFLGLAICYEVVMRYFFNSPTIWSVEVSRLSLLYMAFLAAPWVLKKGGHVTVDVVINYLSPRKQALLNMITSSISAIVYFVIVWYGVKVTLDSFQIHYRLETELRTPQYLILMVIPFGSFFFAVRFLRKTADYLAQWRAPVPRKEEEALEPKPAL